MIYCCQFFAHVEQLAVSWFYEGGNSTMKNVIVTYSTLADLAKENAIRSTRNSVVYSDYVLHELNERAEGLFYDKFGG